MTRGGGHIETLSTYVLGTCGQGIEAGRNNNKYACLRSDHGVYTVPTVLEVTLSG